MYTYTFSYKHPKKRKLVYLDIAADSYIDALKQAPKQLQTGELMYGVT